MLRVHFGQLQLDRPNLLRSFRLPMRELVNIPFAQSLQFFQLFVIARDQSALIGHVADGAGQFAFGDFQIFLRGVNVRFRAGHVGRNRGNLGVTFLFTCPICEASLLSLAF